MMPPPTSRPEGQTDQGVRKSASSAGSAFSLEVTPPEGGCCERHHQC